MIKISWVCCVLICINVRLLVEEKLRLISHSDFSDHMTINFHFTLVRLCRSYLGVDCSIFAMICGVNSCGGIK